MYSKSHEYLQERIYPLLVFVIHSTNEMGQEVEVLKEAQNALLRKKAALRLSARQPVKQYNAIQYNNLYFTSNLNLQNC